MKPLLSATIESPDQIQYPVIASPKLDGIRALAYAGGIWTRSLKLVRNQYVQDKLAHIKYSFFDGELIVGDPTDPLCYTKTSSGIMSGGGTPDFTYYVFDWFASPDTEYEIRLNNVGAPFPPGKEWERIKFLESFKFYEESELMEYEASCVEKGYEGIMIRDPGGRYKYGRSTVKEGILCKVKRFVDTEGVVVGYKEKYRNENEAKINVLGYTERSSHKENRIPAGVLGSLILQHEEFLETVDCGSGFTDAQRVSLWAERESLIGRTVKFKYQPVGVKDKPRFPIFLGWRHPDD